jgi:hypothetical protein
MVAALDHFIAVFDQHMALDTTIPADARERNGEIAAKDCCAKRNGARHYVWLSHDNTSPLGYG